MGPGWCVLLALISACGRIGFDPLTEQFDNWTWQLPLTFDNAGREQLVDVPVLVTFDTSRIDYSQLRSDARDLRFVTPDDVGLAYEIETWDPAGASFVWVRVPRIAAGSTTDRIYAVFGNPQATDAQQPAQVWADYAGVWHLAQAPGATSAARDSSANNNDGMYRGGMAAQNLIAGRTGPALTFDGVDDFIEVADQDSLDLTTFTIEGWVRVSSLTDYSLMSKDGVGTDTGGAYNTYVFPSGDLVYETNNLSIPSIRVCCTAAGQWDYFTFTHDANATSHAYRNGVLGATQADVTPIVNSRNLLLGRRGVADRFLQGELDELRLSTLVRSADWIAAQYASMTDTLMIYGSVEPR